MKVLTDCEEQLDEWIKGSSLHSDHRGLGEECCPDFSCCKPQLLQPIEVRLAFKRADSAQREKLCMVFLGGMITNAAPDVSVYITNGSGDLPE